MSKDALVGKKEVEDFFTFLSKYQARARERMSDYLNADKPVPEFEVRVMYEIFMDVDSRLRRIEEALGE